jgi:hypothetical protein
MAPIRTEDKTSRQRWRQPTLSGGPIRESPKARSVTSKASRNGAARPERVETDVLLCIRPEFVELIVQKKKNHEYRKYKLGKHVKRLWIYETKPVSSVT